MAQRITNLDRTVGESEFSRLLCGMCLKQLIVIRVSEDGLEALLNQTSLGRRLHANLPAMQAFAQLPDEVLHDSAEGARLRREHGVVEVLRRDASPHADSPAKVMGYAIPAGTDALVLFIHDTAGQANLRLPGDRLPQIAYAELLVSIFDCAPSLQEAHFNDWNRLSRNNLAAQRIFEGSRLFRVQLWIDGKAVDVISQGGQFNAGFNSANASSERDGIRRRTTSGVLGALSSGGADGVAAWPYGLPQMPLGYGPVLDEWGEPLARAGGENARWKLIAVNALEVAAVREMLRLVAEGKPWAECGEPLARAKVRCRGNRWKNRTFDQISRAKRASSVRTFVSNPANLQLWQTGRYQRLKKVPVASGDTFEGFEVQHEHGTYGFVAIDANFGLPEGGPFMDEPTARAIEKRLAARETKDGARADTFSLLAFIKPYRDTDGDDFTWERRLAKQSGNYTVRERTRAQSLARGKARGWDPGEGDLKLTTSVLDLELSIGHAVAAAVESVADHKIVVTIHSSGVDDRAEALLAELHDQVGAAAQAKDAGTAADRLAALALSGAAPDEAAAKRHMANATAAYAMAERALARIEELRQEVATLRNEGDQDVVIDLSRPAAVAAFILENAGRDVPLAIGQVLRQLGLESLRLEVDPANNRRVLWRLQLRLPTQDGGEIAMPVSGVVRNRRRDQDDLVRTAEMIDAAIAEEFLRSSASLEALQVSFGKSRGGVVDAIRRHLSRHGVARRGLRSAVVDMPTDLTEPRLALWGLVSADPAVAAHLGAFGDLVARKYAGETLHPNAWVRSDTTLVRKTLRVMTEALPRAGEMGVPIEALARSLGVSRSQVNTLCGDRAKAGSTAARFKGVLVRDPLNPGVVRMKTCPHADCTAAPGDRWLNHFLPVPETDGYNGLLCPHCHRLPDPDLADVYFPDSYFDTLWEGPSSAARFDLRAGAATYVAHEDRYRPGLPLPRHARVFALREAAESLGITDAALRAWIKDPTDPLTASRGYGIGGSKYVLTQQTLDSARGSARHRRLLVRSPRPAGLDRVEFVTLKELAAHVKVAEHFLRDRATKGEMGPTEYKNLNSIGIAHLVVARAVMNLDEPTAGTRLLPAEWIARHRDGLLLMAAAAQLSRQTPSTIRAAVKAGELRSYVTDGGTHRFAREDVEAWAQARAEAPLTPQKAGALAGCSPDHLRRAVARGELEAAKSAGGHLRFNAAVVEAWKARAAGQQGLPTR